MFHLAAPDAFLKERVRQMPEEQVHNTHNTEDGLQRRLAAFRAANTEEQTVLNFYDEREIHPVDIGRSRSAGIFLFLPLFFRLSRCVFLCPPGITPTP